jgi:rubrerythrin
MTLTVPLPTVAFRCVTCGYGISMSGSLPACPMCQKSVWEFTRDRSATSDSPAR